MPQDGTGSVAAGDDSSRSASSTGPLSATRWPPGISSAGRPKRSPATRRWNSGGNSRSSRLASTRWNVRPAVAPPQLREIGPGRAAPRASSIEGRASSDTSPSLPSEAEWRKDGSTPSTASRAHTRRAGHRRSPRCRPVPGRLLVRRTTSPSILLIKRSPRVWSVRKSPLGHTHDAHGRPRAHLRQGRPVLVAVDEQTAAPIDAGGPDRVMSIKLTPAPNYSPSRGEGVVRARWCRERAVTTCCWRSARPTR
jgi:hypothetical protein